MSIIAITQAIAALESAEDYIRDVQNDLILTDNGILDYIKAAIIKAKDSIPAGIPAGTEVSFNAGDEHEVVTTFGEVVQMLPRAPDALVRINSTTNRVIPVADLEFTGPVKLKPWDDACEFEAIYIPENNSGPISKWQFIRMMDGNEDAARNLFDACEWQHPETLIDEQGKEFFLVNGGEDE